MGDESVVQGIVRRRPRIPAGSHPPESLGNAVAWLGPGLMQQAGPARPRKTAMVTGWHSFRNYWENGLGTCRGGAGSVQRVASGRGVRMCSADGARKCAGFTLLELLVVIAIIGLLATMILPTLSRARYLVGEKVCAANMRGTNTALNIYAEENKELFPVEATEHNPHKKLVDTLAAYDTTIIDAMYCPQANVMDMYARNTSDYVPSGSPEACDYVLDTEENRQKGNISYIYWSFAANKYCATASGSENNKHWRNPDYFIPRALGIGRVVEPPTWKDAGWRAAQSAAKRQRIKECREASPHSVWVMSDWFRRTAPFPHLRAHKAGLNIGYLDGHVDLYVGRPRDAWR